MSLRLATDGVTFQVRREAPGRARIVGPSGEVREVEVVRRAGGAFLINTPEGFVPAEAVREASRVWVRLRGRTWVFDVLRGTRKTGSGPRGDLSSPMPGQVQRLLVAAGDAVEAQQPLLVVEAMKMQLEIKAPHGGRVTRILAAEGDRVDAGVPLVELEPAP
jgi:3-methylcrotonyl-CoA carboxylase alpha subunit